MRPVYTAHGFSLNFDTDDTSKVDHMRVVCRVFHAAGHAETHHVDLPCDGKGARGGDVMTCTHAMGSAISYARRYLLGMIFGIAVDKDDDGNAAGRSPAPQPPPPTSGRCADRFYREPDHDPRTGEVFEDPAQATEDEAANESREAFVSSTRQIIRQAHNWQELGIWWNSPEQKKARRDFALDPEQVAGLVGADRGLEARGRSGGVAHRGRVYERKWGSRSAPGSRDCGHSQSEHAGHAGGG